MEYVISLRGEKLLSFDKVTHKVELDTHNNIVVTNTLNNKIAILINASIWLSVELQATK